MENKGYKFIQFKIINGEHSGIYEKFDKNGTPELVSIPIRTLANTVTDFSIHDLEDMKRKMYKEKGKDGIYRRQVRIG